MIDNKQKQILFLGSKEFVSYIKNLNLEPLVYNKLFSVHLLTLGIQSTGVSSGSICLSYRQELTNSINYKNEPLTANSGYFFCTTKNSVIENTIYSSRSGLNIRNYNGFSNEFRNVFTFNSFLKSYINEFKPVHCSFEELTEQIFKVSINKKSTIDEKYKTLVEEIPELRSVLNYYFINILTKKDIKTSTRLKI